MCIRDSYSQWIKNKSNHCNSTQQKVITMAVKKRSKVSAEFNMSSLTDIIFLLLIFFMLTSSIVTPNALNLQLPGKKTSPPPPKAKNKIVSIDESGAYTLNGAPISLDGVKRQME